MAGSQLEGLWLWIPGSARCARGPRNDGVGGDATRMSQKLIRATSVVPT
jgi:hypothetical protein